MISFKKNLFTVFFAIALVLIGSWLVGLPKAVVIDGMTLVIATMIMTLLIEDFWRKWLNARELLTWEYFAGALIISGSVMAWLWASESVTTVEMGWRLGATFLSAVLGAVWMATLYAHSVRTDDERTDVWEARAQKKWQKWQKKLAEATPEDRVAILGHCLIYRTDNDRIDGGLVFDRPLIVDGERVLSYEEAEKEGVDGNLLAQARDYIHALSVQEEEK